MSKRRMTRRATIVAGTVASLSVAGIVAAVGQTTPTSQQWNHSQLAYRAVMPANTFRAGSAPTGQFFGSFDRTSAAANGFTFPAAPAPAFNQQPIQGISAVVPTEDGEFWALSDNGYGVRQNSVDYELWVSKIHASFANSGSSVVPFAGFGLSDPKGFIPWKIVCDQRGANLPDFDFNVLPATPPSLCGDARLRKLTGFDFDLESMQVGSDGTFWFGDEFGPYLLHTSAKGELLSAPIPLPGVKSPQNPTLAPGEVPNLASSRGFEGMAINPARTRLYPLAEGPVTGYFQNDLAIREFDLATGQYTNRQVLVRLELPGTFANASSLRKSDGSLAFPGATPPPAGSEAIGELTMLNESQAILIERDGGGDAPNVPRFKKLWLLDFNFNEGGYARKTMLLDLMAIPDPRNIGQDGSFFRMPFVTIESVTPLDDHSLLVVNDNNFPFSNGRAFSKTPAGPYAPDDNEFVVVTLDQRLRVEPSLLPIWARK